MLLQKLSSLLGILQHQNTPSSKQATMTAAGTGTEVSDDGLS